MSDWQVTGSVHDLTHKSSRGKSWTLTARGKEVCRTTDDLRILFTSGLSVVKYSITMGICGRRPRELWLDAVTDIGDAGFAPEIGCRDYTARKPI